MTVQPAASKPNPMRLREGFKLGLFGYLHQGGNAITTVPERWSAHWDDIVAMARMADAGGLDFLMPIARWKGIPGEVNNRLWSFETLTHAAALSGITEHIALFATVHTPIVHPIFAAKAMTTIDHASHGRAGLNIVCGWNQSDFDMFGFTQLDHDERYRQGSEWFEIWSRLIAGADVEFDFEGEFFKGKGLSGMPGSVQRERPVVLAAGYSPAGRRYAAKYADYFLTVLTDEETGKRDVAELRAIEREVERNEPLRPIAVAYVVCREKRSEAEAFHRYYAEDMADHKGVDAYVAGRAKQAAMPEAVMRELRIRWAGGNSAYPLIGTPEDVVAGFLMIQRAGFAGAALSFLNFRNDLPFFLERVLPLARQAGLLRAA